MDVSENFVKSFVKCFVIVISYTRLLHTERKTSPMNTQSVISLGMEKSLTGNGLRESGPMTESEKERGGDEEKPDK